MISGLETHCADRLAPSSSNPRTPLVIDRPNPQRSALATDAQLDEAVVPVHAGVRFSEQRASHRSPVAPSCRGAGRTHCNQEETDPTERSRRRRAQARHRQSRSRSACTHGPRIHHQPEAQHPKSFSYPQELPHLWTMCGRLRPRLTTRDLSFLAPCCLLRAFAMLGKARA